MLTSIFFAAHLWVWRILPYLAVFSFFALIGFQFGLTDTNAYLLSLLISALSCATIIILQRKVMVLRRFSFRPSGAIALILVILMGTILRVSWILLFPVEQVSDSATYVALANTLINGNPYLISDSRAYWPPGYPFFLFVVHLGTFKVTTLTVSIVNILLYWGGSLMLYSITNRMTDGKYGLVSVILFALWPNHIALVSIASKELLVIFLLLLTARVYSAKGLRRSGLLIGLPLGVSILVQPGSILFISVFIVANWASGMAIGSQIRNFALAALGAALVVAPWTYRNYLVFDEFVLLGTNGGYNFYRANNEDAHGGYLAEGRVDLSGYDELTTNRLASDLAKEWIINNPVDFAVLSFRKMVLFLGDDSLGMYESTKRAALHPLDSEYSYLALKLLSTLFWLMLWLFFLLNRSGIDQIVSKRDRLFNAIPLCFLYFFAVHSVFESNGKYHIPVVWALFVIVAVVIFQLRERDRETSGKLPLETGKMGV